MASIDSLPADQRAVLELVLRRGQSYDEIAQLLSIDRAGVRQRALAAFDALGPQTRVASDRRALITDYLLDALPGGVAEEVREHLRGSASERAWARAVASELQGLSDQPLPEIPANGRRAQPKAEGRKPGREGRRKPSPAPRAEVPVAAALSNGSPRERAARRVASRTGGAVLLGAAAAVAIALVLVFVVFSGGASHKRRALAHQGTTPALTPTTTSTTGSSPKVLAQINLTPPGGGSSPLGAAEVVSLQGKTGVVLVAHGLAPTRKHPPNYYAAWLYNSPTDAYFLGFAGAVGSNKVLETAGAIPRNAARFHKLLLTLETTASPKHPGTIVLQGNVTGL